MQARPKIICLGANKSGTSSLHHFFSGNGIAAVHRGGADRHRNIAQIMLRNASAARPLLTGLEHFEAFSDISYNDGRISIDVAAFAERLFADYSDACFVYNHRPREAWVQSRAKHHGGHLLRNTQRAYGMEAEAVLEMWRAYHAAHGARVRALAERHGARFLDFAVGATSPDALVSFLRPDYDTDTAYWHTANTGARRTWRNRLRHWRARFT